MEKDKKQKDLEATLKEKIEPLLEQTIGKHLGISLPDLESDITDKLKQPSFSIYVPFHLPFSKAKKFFRKEFLRKCLHAHQGNISQLAKILNVDRRSVHRTIKDLGIKIKDIRTKPLPLEQQYEELIGQTLHTTLEPYEEILHPEKMEKLYQQVKSLSKSIAKFLPHEELTWKQAEKEFERQFLYHSLEEAQWNISRTAKKIKLRPETLHRKIKKLGLRK